MRRPPRTEACRVLITGSTRCLGRQLTESLYYDKRVEMVVATARDREVPYYYRYFDRHRFSYQPLNLNRYRSLQDFFQSRPFRDAEINTVVHLAFRGNPQTYGARTHRLNVEGTKNFLDRCLHTKSVTQFVYFSSACVYKLHPSNPVALREGDDLNFDPHAHPIVQDAVGAEMLCRAQMDHPRCSIVVLRPSGMIGRNVASELNLLFESAVCFTPMGFDPMVNPIHSLDVVRALKQVMAHDVRGIYNVAGPDIGPLSEFLRLAGCRNYAAPFAMLGRLYKMARTLSLTKFDFDLNGNRLRYSLVLDGDKAARDLGFRPRHHIKFG